MLAPAVKASASCVIGIAVLWACVSGPVRAARWEYDQGGEERRILFLHGLLERIHWPPGAFQDEAEALRLLVIGRDDSLNGLFDRMLEGKMIGRRSIVVTHATAPTTAPLPHVVFLAGDQAPQLPEVLAAYCRTPVLTVSDIDRFANRGGAIGLVEGGVYDLILDDHAVHFVVNRIAFYEARLQLDPDLLYLAYPLFSAVSPCRPSRTTSGPEGSARH
jgi:hypothetical protein